VLNAFLPERITSQLHGAAFRPAQLAKAEALAARVSIEYQDNPYIR